LEGRHEGGGEKALGHIDRKRMFAGRDEVVNTILCGERPKHELSKKLNVEV